MPNPSPLSQRQTGFRLPMGEWFNDIIDRVNGLVAGTFTGSWTGTFDGPLGDTTPDTASVTDFTQNGTVTRLPQTLAAAGATQGDAAEITSGTVLVTVTASTQGIRLPAWATGEQVQVFAAQTIGVTVYPPTGGQIGGGATNAGVVLAAGKANIYMAGATSGIWRVMTGA